MTKKYIDKSGLTYFWSKIKALLANKADKTHSHNYAGSSSAGGAATKAIADGNGNNIVNTYVTKQELQAALNALNLGFSADESDM